MSIISAKAKLSAVIGYPVSHSLSPKLHGYWLDKYNIDGTYIALPVTPEDLKTTIRILHASGFAGCNITIPHKERVFQIAGEKDKIAEKTGATNTLLFHEGSILCYNTDVEGFVNNLKYQVSDIIPDKAVMLGAGGAARAAAYGLSMMGFKELTVISRDKNKAENIAKIFDGNFKYLQWSDRNYDLSNCGLLVNTTNLGMSGSEKLDLDISSLDKTSIVYDLIYNPLKTDLIKAAESRNIRAINGLGMLIFQAVKGFNLWYGKEPEVTPEIFAYLENCMA